jgi:hypothetical protein
MKILQRIERAIVQADSSRFSADLSQAADTCAFDLARKLKPGQVSGFIVLGPGDGEMPSAFREVDPKRITTIKHELFEGSALALIELTDFDDPLLGLSVALALESARAHRDCAVCGWFFSQESGSNAIRRFSRTMEYAVRGTRERYLLFAHRPRRALLLPWLLETAQWGESFLSWTIIRGHVRNPFVYLGLVCGILMIAQWPFPLARVGDTQSLSARCDVCHRSAVRRRP